MLFTTRKTSCSENYCYFGQPTHSNMELNNSLNGLVSPRLGEDEEFEVSTPRLSTPFYEALKKKYPQAFKRRTSISSQASDTASVCSDSSFSSAYVLSAAQTVKRPRAQVTATTNQNSSCREGLPPLPPGGGRSKKNGEQDDFSIIGSPRRGRLKRLAAKAARNSGGNTAAVGVEYTQETDENNPSNVSNLSKSGEQYASISSLRSERILPSYYDEDESRRSGNLQKGGLYSSSRSLQLTEDSHVMRNRLYKADSTQSLKDKLKKNQDSWKRLLATNNSPFKEVKPKIRVKDHKDRLKKDLPTRSGGGGGKLTRADIMGEKPMVMNNVIRTLEDIQNRIASQADLAKRKRIQNLSRSQTPNNELENDGNHFLPVLTNTQNGTLDEDVSRDYSGADRVKPSKRLQSPDSHDSAVDLDSVSLQSSPPMSDVTRTSQLRQQQQQAKRQHMLNGHDSQALTPDSHTDSADLRINLNFLKDSDSDVSPRRKPRKSPDKLSPSKQYRHGVNGKSTNGANSIYHKDCESSSNNFVSNAFLKLDSNDEEELLEQATQLPDRRRSVGETEGVTRNSVVEGNDSSPKQNINKPSASRDSDDSGFDGRTPKSPKKYSVTSHDPLKRQHSEEQGESSSERSGSVNQSSRLHKLRSRQKSQECKPSTPLKADHSIVTPRGEYLEREVLPTRPHSALKDPISSSKENNNKTNRPRSASADSRRNRVVFEDEVSEDLSKSTIHRAGSQPVLHTGTTNTAGGVTEAKDITAGGNIPSQQKFHIDNPHLAASVKMDDIEIMQRLGGSVTSQVQEAKVAKVTLASAESRNTAVSPDTDVHKAGPVVLMPKPSQGTPHKVQKAPKPKESRGSLKLRIANTSLRRASVSSNDNDVNEEVAMITSALEGGVDRQKDGRPKLPWKKNKGRYTPSEEVEKAQMQAVKNVSQKSHWSSLYLASKAKQEQAIQKTDDMSSTNRSDCSNLNSANENEGNKTPPIKPPRSKKAARQKGGKASEVAMVESGRRVRGKGDYDDVEGYQDVELGHQGSRARKEPKQEVKRDSRDVRKRQTEGGYEDVERYQQESESLTSGTSEQSPRVHTEVDAVYAVVQKRQSRPRTKTPNVPPAFADDYEEEEIYTRPPIPERGYESNLKSSKELSGSRSSLMDNFKDTAKRRFGQLRRALSVDRINKEDTQESGTISQDSGKMKKSPSLKSLFGKKKSGSYEIGSPQEDLSRSQIRSASTSAISHVELPRNYRQLGKILSVSPDCTQVIELMKPPHGPFGFFIARGKAKYNHGIFVSRLGDGLPEHFFAGLLGIGDEILEINALPLQKMALDDIYDLMGQSEKLTLKILPFISRKDS